MVDLWLDLADDKKSVQENNLRDEIAMRAMQGHLASEYGAMVHSDKENRKALAREFYKIADIMINVRNETK